MIALVVDGKFEICEIKYISNESVFFRIYDTDYFVFAPIRDLLLNFQN